MVKKLIDNKIFNFIISLLETILFIGLILYISFIILQRLSSNASVGGYSFYAVATGSMVPIYKADDVIVVKNVEAKDLKVGDDIVYKGKRGGFENKIVVHRIIKIEKAAEGGYKIFTKGVNNSDADPSIDETQVVGRVIRKVYTVSIVNKIVRNQFGFFFLIFCPFIMVISVEIMETSIERKYKNDESVNQEKENLVNKENMGHNKDIKDIKENTDTIEMLILEDNDEKEIEELN